ncbi:MAG: indole-3-glycerol phosphate synthase TrpC [Sphaerochaetaceae bacterium]|nr:indole-3-glycerol phosphate synthase TrpC [Sphaerochaetaceae bacterium]MDC7243915.1 indole-3-glycerol phosphate synthase TrpC [Sphaerochaetaceae bacterium]
MILDDIAEKTRMNLSLLSSAQRNKIKQKAYSLEVSNSFEFYKALSKPGLSFIAEVKKASPSKGLICENFKPVEIALEYERIGIDAISVLTERDYFQGDLAFLKEISNIVSTPTLRKDFIVDVYQVHEAKVIGAKAILLICALLKKRELEFLYNEATLLGLDVLVEAHTKEEVEMALSIDAKIIGINNRNLKTFKVDLSISERMRKYIPSNKIMVSESGYSTREDILKAIDIGSDAVLIGESFMKSDSKEELLNTFKGSLL